MWGEEDSNLRSRKTTDLQSVPFGHSGISPKLPVNNKREPMEGFEPPTYWLQISSSDQLSYIGLIMRISKNPLPLQKGIANVDKQYQKSNLIDFFLAFFQKKRRVRKIPNRQNINKLTISYLSNYLS